MATQQEKGGGRMAIKSSCRLYLNRSAANGKVCVRDATIFNSDGNVSHELDVANCTILMNSTGIRVVGLDGQHIHTIQFGDEGFNEHSNLGSTFLVKDGVLLISNRLQKLANPKLHNPDGRIYGAPQSISKERYEDPDEEILWSPEVHEGTPDAVKVSMDLPFTGVQHLGVDRTAPRMMEMEVYHRQWVDVSEIMDCHHTFYFNKSGFQIYEGDAGWSYVSYYHGTRGERWIKPIPVHEETWNQKVLSSRLEREMSSFSGRAIPLTESLLESSLRGHELNYVRLQQRLQHYIDHPEGRGESSFPDDCIELAMWKCPNQLDQFLVSDQIEKELSQLDST